MEINENPDNVGGISGIEFVEGNDEGESDNSDSSSDSESDDENVPNFNFQQKKAEEIDIDNI